MRPVLLPDDEPFLKTLFFSTIEEMAAKWPLPEEQKAGLMDMQYRAQKMQYDAQFPDGIHTIIVVEGVEIGRLYRDYEEGAVIGVDLTILPEYRGKGIGTAIIDGIKQEAADTGRVFRFHVMKTNRAIGLYDRIGMSRTGETEIQYSMEWKPNGEEK